MRTSAVFWDVGGVLLTNAWDHSQRRKVLASFGLDAEGFEARHRRCVEAFETGRLSLDGYLERTVFYRKRPFSKERFRGRMFAASKPLPGALAAARRIRRSGVLMSTLNNESAELNRFRIERFGLLQLFDLFLSSCWLGVRKPDPAIYEKALELTGRDPRECVFIDDRPENLAAPRRLGFRVIRHENPPQLERELARLLP
jgi:putative hydrolase of the HAD superfamily